MTGGVGRFGGVRIFLAPLTTFFHDMPLRFKDFVEEEDGGSGVNPQ